MACYDIRKKERIKVPICYLVIGFNKKPRRKLNVWPKISSFFKIVSIRKSYLHKEIIIYVNKWIEMEIVYTAA